MPLSINHQYKSPNYESRKPGTTIRLIVLHATVGTTQSAINWLCNPISKASTHYIISKTGDIYQLVSDDHIAWHAGVSAWRGVANCNEYSIGIELENTNSGRDIYPESQLAALRQITAQLLRDYPQIHDVVTHAEIALPSGRKTDPAGFPLESFRVWVANLFPPPQAAYTELSPLLLSLGAIHTPLHITLVRGSHYTPIEINKFVARYEEMAISAGLDPTLVIAQMLHETGWLTSWWCERPRRNPAGIGVNGDVRVSAVQPGPGWAKHSDGTWHAGQSYRTWLNDSIPDHIGRLLAYVLPVATGTELQQKLIQRSNARRPIPLPVRGTAQLLKQLGRVHNASGLGWASPGEKYGTAIAKIANSIAGRT